MNPTMMLTLLVSAWAAFAWSANRRWQLLKVGRSENRLDDIGRRLKMLYEYALVQKKMNYYPLAGLAHKLIFLGFSVLLLRSLILWGRGFDPAFNFGILGENPVSLPLLGAVPIGTYVELQKQYLEAVEALLDTRREALESAQNLEHLTGLSLSLVSMQAKEDKP